MHRLAIAIDHPIQYHAPLYSFLARDGRFDLRVFFMSDRGARAYYDEFAKREVRHDNPIVDGYDHVFLGTGEPKTWWTRRTEFVDFGLAKAITEFRPDAVYFHGYTNLSFWHAIRACRREGIGVLFRGENEEILPRPAWRNVVRETFLKLFFPRVDAFLWIGQENREFYRRRGIPEEKLFHVPYSVDNDYFAVGDDERRSMRHEIRDRYALAPTCRLFIYTHKLRATMRPLDAIEAFIQAMPRLPSDCAFVVCGDGELMPAARAIVERDGAGRVILAGYLSQADLRRHMLAADVMVNPAIEPWGCSVNEGLACGLAQISSDMVVGWPDMVREGENGVVHPAGKIDALASRMVELSTMSDERLHAMQQRSLAIAHELSFAACADGLDAATSYVVRERRERTAR